MIISHNLPGCRVHLLGQQPRGIFEATYAGVTMPPARCHLQVASDATKPGFRTIVPWQETTPQAPMLADGVLLRQSQTAAIFHTADCPAVILDSPTQTIALHAGRPAMTPDENGQNIIHKALALLTEPHNTYVYITGAISGKHFQHDHEGKREQTLPFLETYGPVVFADVGKLALDLVAVIRTQLHQAGTPPEHVLHDGVCTYETEGLTSHRRGGAERTTTNTVVVIKT